MSRKRKNKRGGKRSKARKRGDFRSRTSLYVTIPLVALVIIVGGIWLLKRRQPVDAATPAEVAAEIIPHEGEPTAYGIPLSLDNAQRFIDYYETATLTAEQESIKEDALLPLKAPCCDDNPMSTCCCPCNLAKSVWGLSSYLIVEEKYDVEQVRESALQWLRFIQSDYYVGQELKNKGVNPDKYGLPHGDACYTGRCELPFVDDGCGGMGALKQ